MKKLIFIFIIFMVSGTSFTVNVFADFYIIPSNNKNYAPVEKSGQTVFSVTRDDGDLEQGIEWPDPRFTDNNNGTVTDNMTDLIWVKYPSCSGTTDWASAIEYCNSLANGMCSLTDGSAAGDWRLPNIKEILSLIDYGHYNPALPSDHPFSLHNYYWTSTTYSGSTPDAAWNINITTGIASITNKDTTYYIWPVRGGN